MLRHRPALTSPGIIGKKSPTMERTLFVNSNKLKCRRSLIWGIVNILFLTIFLYDLSYKCPIYTTWFNYFEYFAIIIFGLNTLYHVFRYVYYSVKTDFKPMYSRRRHSDEHKREVTFQETESTPISSPTPLVISPPASPNSTYEASLQCTPLNWSALSWRSSSTANDSMNFSMASPSWIFYRGSPEQKNVSVNTPQKLQYPDTSGIEFISDEKSLKQYLHDYEHYEKAVNASSVPEQNVNNLLSSFWSHPVTQNPNELSPFLRRSQYQLSSQSPCAVNSTSGKVDENSASLNVPSLGTEVWKKLQIDPHTLIQWNANLRMWISQTILDRLVAEIRVVNDEFVRYHLNDVKIGNVGLERLRKTAQTTQVIQHIPTLTALLPFLEISPNQEYLVKRIKELSKGGCMSEFKWNSGANFHAKEWDDSLVNDSEIIIHLLATYLDCQLVSLPNQPDAKPFSKEHFIRPTEKVPHNPLTLAIHQITEKPPHFRLIVGEDVFEVAKGHNNLFYTILLFLYFVNKKEHGMLGKVNMGRSGVNMLWIIEEN